MTSDELIAVFADLGCTDVGTFLASGNVLFAGDLDPQAAAAALEAALGYAVPTTVRTGSELVAIGERMPFDAHDLAASTGKPQVMLLFEKPGTVAKEKILAMSGPENRLAFHGQELHWLPAAGMSESTLDLKQIGKLVGENTVRTANTITRLVAKL